jgi:hypothetical protein
VLRLAWLRVRSALRWPPCRYRVEAYQDPCQTTVLGHCVDPASPWWATRRKQRLGSGEKASA